MQRTRIFWLPFVLCIALIGFFIATGLFFANEDQSLRRQKASTVAIQTKAYLESFSAERKQALQNLMDGWPSYEANIEDWFNVQAQQLSSMQKGYSSLLHTDRQGVITWVYTPVNQDIESRLTSDMVGQTSKISGLEVDISSEAMAHRIVRDQSSGEIIHYLVVGRAISPQEPDLGTLIVSYNLNNILAALLGDLAGVAGDVEEAQFNLRLQDDAHRLFDSEKFDPTDNTLAQENVEFIYRDWIIQVQSRPFDVPSGLVIAILGSLMSAFLSLFVHKQLKSAYRLHVSQSRYRTASDAALDGLLILEYQDGDFTVLEANQIAVKMLGKDITRLRRSTISVHLRRLEKAQLFDDIMMVRRSGIPFETYIHIENGTIEPEWLKIQVVKAANNVAITLRDVTSRFRAQQALKQSEEKYRRLVDGLHRHFVYTKTPEHQFEYVSAGVADIFGMSPEAFCTYESTMVYQRSDESQRAAKQSSNQYAPYVIEYMSKEHGIHIIEYADTPVLDDNNRVIAIEGIAKDVTEERRLRKEVEFQATHDQLTGLFNRYAFDEHLNILLDHVRAGRHTAVMCFIDMDRFKLVNDSCGHPAGDRLLKEVAHIFGQHVTGKDTLARIGGDEFCIIFRDIGLSGVKKVLNAILQDIGNYRFQYSDQIFFIGASIGVIEVDTQKANAAELIKAADNACYQAKYAGRNRYHIYQPNESEKEIGQLETETLVFLHNAMEERGFVLYCQLIQPLSLNSDHYQYEILVRMENNKGELVSPGLFIPLAERHGLMSKIDWWVVDNALASLENACDHLVKLDKVAINLSGTTLNDESTMQRIILRVEQSQVPAQKICFEITETAAVTNLMAAQDYITQLRGIGCRFALDDFGAGMSSFTYLKNLDVDYVKIDGSFVRNMCRDPIDYATVKAINSIAQSMGKQTVAEFVSEVATRNALRELHVDFGQGFALGKPVPLHDVLLNVNQLYNSE